MYIYRYIYIYIYIYIYRITHSNTYSFSPSLFHDHQLIYLILPHYLSTLSHTHMNGTDIYALRTHKCPIYVLRILFACFLCLNSLPYPLFYTPRTCICLFVRYMFYTYSFIYIYFSSLLIFFPFLSLLYFCMPVLTHIHITTTHSLSALLVITGFNLYFCRRFIF